MTNFSLTEMIHEYNETTNPQIKRALLVLCNAMYKEMMGVKPKYVDPMIPIPSEVSIGKYQGKIPMIKAHRARTGIGLLESKQACEGYFTDHGLEFYYHKW